MQQRVIFRVWDDGSGVCALFPDTLDTAGLVSYYHGFHEEQANYEGVLRNSRPATPDEYAPVLQRLRARGDNIRPVAAPERWERYGEQERIKKDAPEKHTARRHRSAG